MRRTICKAIDRWENRSRKEQIIAKRGALRWLPVYFENDLVHGSWWFVLGSIYVILTAAIIIANSFDVIIGEDDSVLSRFHYRATWVLMLGSGVFFALGSLAFVRACNEPPLPPLFPNCYHLQSDELLGSWLFTIAAIPFVPCKYSMYVCMDACFLTLKLHNNNNNTTDALIYLFEAQSSSDQIMYLAACCVAVLVIVASYLFVRACYPSTEKSTRRQYILPLFTCLFSCCCSEKWLSRNLANDWLAGCWLMFWATLFASIVCFMLFIAGNY